MKFISCRCVRGIIQVSRETQQQQTQRPEQTKQDKEPSKDQTRVQPVDDMLTSENDRLGQVASTGVELKANAWFSLDLTV